MPAGPSFEYVSMMASAISSGWRSSLSNSISLSSPVVRYGLMNGMGRSVPRRCNP
jgi:hypothetical protein